ncbi:MAG TPA: outer membrane lipoprotein carrier protein LolA [Terriglobales bacterium]|nr:outer membrane lipoprotein carrier protein LolA [Terriglobales bacterium]
MRFHSVVVKVTLLWLAVFTASAASLPDVHAVAKAVDEHYNHLRSLQAEFTEIFRGAGMDRTESGTLWLKKPGKMRWEYRSPKDKLFLSDGKDAWFYLPADKQVRKTPVKKLEDLRSPLGLLLGKTRLEKELHGLGFAPDVTPLIPGDLVMRGVPQALADRVSEVVLEITPENQIRRIQIEDVNGAVTEYRFEQQREDVDIGDGRFRFTPPLGVEMIEEDFGQ